MIVVVLHNPAKTSALDVELRMLIRGMTEEEADALGEAIRDFAVAMDRHETITGFQLDEDEKPV